VKSKCYFCDIELSAIAHSFRIAMKEEPVCDECYTKTVNRKKAKEQEGTS
jgi:hypothetical protein